MTPTINSCYNNYKVGVGLSPLKFFLTKGGYQMMYSRCIIAIVLFLGLLLGGNALLNFSTTSDQIDNLIGSIDNSDISSTTPEELPGLITEGLSEEGSNTEIEVSISLEGDENEQGETGQAPETAAANPNSPANSPVQSNNNLSATQTASANSKLPTHKVVKGESLFLISRHYRVNVNELRRLNNLTTDEILVGQVLALPAGAKPQAQAMQTASRNSTTGRFTENDVYWLAKIIYAEARGEIYEGQVAVGAVVLNRVRSSIFPNTVYGVIFEKWDGKYYQFSPVLDGTINLEPNETSKRAAREAINGRDPSGGALYFYNPVTSTNKWIYDRPIIKRIGKHVFAL
jgi:N-acetylmuramoyl-L-alanine amidase